MKVYRFVMRRSIVALLVDRLKESHDLEFVNTDRLSGLKDGTMTRSHVLGNWLLSATTKLLFGWPFNDSQSGMWIFRRYVWDDLDVRSSGMPFSQELKIEAFVRGFRCDEVPIEYRARAGKEKLNTIGDGLGNVTQLVKKRLSLGAALRPTASAPDGAADAEGTRAPRRAVPAAAPLADQAVESIGGLWDERWYDRDAHVDLSVLERGPHIPLPAMAGAGSPASQASDKRRMVVWRARPPSATATAGGGAFSERAV